MLVKNVKIQNAFGKTIEKELFFNLNAMEQFEFEARFLTKKFDTVEKFMKHILQEKDYPVIVEFIKDLVLSAYGVPDEDPNSDTYGELLKTPSIKQKFENSFAYADVFEDLFTNENNLAKFVDAVKYKKLGSGLEDKN